MAEWEFAVLVAEKGCFLRGIWKGLCRQKAFGLWKREFFEDNKERLV